MNFSSDTLAVNHLKPTQIWDQLVQSCRRCFDDNVAAVFDTCINRQVFVSRAMFEANHNGKDAAVDVIDIFQNIQSDLCPLLEAKHINLGIDGQCHENMFMDRDRFQLALFAIVLESLSVSQASSDIDVTVDQYARYLEVEIADSSDRRICSNTLPASIWSVRCAAYLLSSLPVNYEVTNCPQGGLAIRIKVDTYASRMAA